MVKGVLGTGTPACLMTLCENFSYVILDNLMSANGIAAQDLLDERGRELYQECWRRNDLIRFGKFVSGYTWQWKGEVKEGRDAESYRTLFPIPTQDLQANTNLTQNEGYL